MGFLSLVDKTKVSLTRDLCESSRLLETNDERAYAPPSRDWHLIGTIQFLSRRAFGPFDNLVALYLGIEHKGDPKKLDIKWQRSLFEIIWKDSMWKMIELVPHWINWLRNCTLNFLCYCIFVSYFVFVCVYQYETHHHIFCCVFRLSRAVEQSLKKLTLWLCAAFVVLLSLCILLSLCLCLSIRNTSTYFLLCV